MTLANNNRLQITELDFDLILQNLQSFLQGNPTFNSYNFVGSGLQTLLRVLAYNDHYGAYYVNMLANEMKVSTAQVRDNLVKLAKELNYVPKSMTSPTAFVNIIATPNLGNNYPTLSLPAYTTFMSQAINGTNYNYMTTQAYTASLANNQFAFANVAIQEGVVINYQYIASTTNPRNSFNIPNANIDTSTLIVNVTENTPSPPTVVPYTLALDVSLLTGNSRVFFLEGTDNSTYNLYFGDGILGRALIPGDIVTATYIVTNGGASNQANNFTLMAPINGLSNVVVQSVTASAGGGVAETNDSIRTNAPLSYTTQERAVTIADYNFLLTRDYNNIGSMAMWDGKQNNPPIYGSIFLSIKPKIGQFLSTLQKQQVSNILTKYNMPTTIPQIVDPDYTYLLVKVWVNYNPNKTNISQNQLITNISNAIINYGNTQLGKFNGTYAQSGISDAIENVDPSILGTNVISYLQKRFFPKLGQNATYTFYFNTSLHRGGLLEKLYSSPAAIFNDSFGVQRNCFLEENINTYQGITAFAVNNPGFGFTSQPTVNIFGDGNGAQAHAIVVNGTIQSVVLDVPGEGYNFATATITDGGGYGAVITPILAAQTGILDTYYFTNTNKGFISTNQGTVDHVNGIITLNNFAPLDINNLTKQLAINVKPDTDLIIPQRNNILLIDPNDPAAISITLMPQII